MGREHRGDAYVILAGVRTDRMAAIELAVAEHFATPDDGRIAVGYTPPPPPYAQNFAQRASHTAQCSYRREVDDALRSRGQPLAIVLFVGGDGLLAAHLAAYAAAHDIPMLLYADTPYEPLADLQAVMHTNPRAVFMHASIDRAPTRVRRFLERPEARCATGRVLAGLPLRGDRVTQAMLTQIAVGSRRGLSSASLAAAHHMTTSAVRARFAQSGLIAPRDVTTAVRALHALWYLIEASDRPEVVAHRMNLGSRENVLERVRAGTGQCYRTWKASGGFDAALAVAMRRLVTTENF